MIMQPFETMKRLAEEGPPEKVWFTAVKMVSVLTLFGAGFAHLFSL